MKAAASTITTIVALGFSSIVSAVCPAGNVFAIGTPATSGSNQIYNIYNAGSCASSQSLTVAATPGVCDSRYFMCSPLTKSIGQYDDPKTGISYACSPDTSSEQCGSDTITYCCTWSPPAKASS